MEDGCIQTRPLPLAISTSTGEADVRYKECAEKTLLRHISKQTCKFQSSPVDTAATPAFDSTTTADDKSPNGKRQDPPGLVYAK